MSSAAPRPDPLWIFGYGSLVWRPAFAFAERRPGWITGFARRFWQGSTDHRGVPGSPGRVATIVPDPESICWGVAYRVESARVDEVLATLDHRERGGFERHIVATVLRPTGEESPKSVSALLYKAKPDNAEYLGPAPLDEIARQVSRSAGPSGANVDYVLELARALRAMGARDDHVFELERLVVAAERPSSAINAADRR